MQHAHQRPVPARVLAVLAGMVGLVVLSTGCSAVGDLTASRRPDEPMVAVIGVVVPLDGPQAAAGAGVRDAVRLAVDEAGGAVGGWSIDLLVLDDRGQPEPAIAAASELGDDPAVVAAIGGLSAPVVRAVQPVLGAREVLFLSPADTEPTHTRGADPGTPVRPYPTYFSVATASPSEAETAAAYLERSVGEGSRVAVLDGGRPEDATRRADLANEAGAHGLDVVTVPLYPESSPSTEPSEPAEPTAAAGPAGPGEPTGSPVPTGSAEPSGPSAPPTPSASPTPTGGPEAALAVARAADVDAVYVAADTDTAVAVVRALASDGWSVPLVGPDELRTDGFAETAGRAAEGFVVVTPAMGTTADEGGDLAGRAAARGLVDPGPFGAAAYDAATAVLQALSRCLPTAESVEDARDGCVAEMSQVSFSGLTGPVAFTEFGERTAGTPPLWEVRDGTWAPLG
ncbi:MAG TPA: ABC transporter substrate-binding protein [Jiangellales bacterium]|nr:ABC transporter substrate-binding protein [Jiangellales bacterium]